jgi:hypothetical protein
MQFLLIGFCITWILLCGRMWWNMSRKNSIQRRLVALGAGLGAALFYTAGMKLIHAMERYNQPTQATERSSEDVRISLPGKQE